MTSPPKLAAWALGCVCLVAALFQFAALRGHHQVWAAATVEYPLEPRMHGGRDAVELATQRRFRDGAFVPIRLLAADLAPLVARATGRPVRSVRAKTWIDVTGFPDRLQILAGAPTPALAARTANVAAQEFVARRARQRLSQPSLAPARQLSSAQPYLSAARVTDLPRTISGVILLACTVALWLGSGRRFLPEPGRSLAPAPPGADGAVAGAPARRAPGRVRSARSAPRPFRALRSMAGRAWCDLNDGLRAAGQVPGSAIRLARPAIMLTTFGLTVAVQLASAVALGWLWAGAPGALAGTVLCVVAAAIAVYHRLRRDRDGRPRTGAVIQTPVMLRTASPEPVSSRRPLRIFAITFALAGLCGAIAPGDPIDWILIGTFVGVTAAGVCVGGLPLFSVGAVSATVFVVFFALRALHLELTGDGLLFPVGAGSGSPAVRAALSISAVGAAAFWCGYWLRIGERIGLRSRAFAGRLASLTPSDGFGVAVVVFALLAVIGFGALYGSPLSVVSDAAGLASRRTADYGNGITAWAFQCGTVAVVGCYAMLSARAPSLIFWAGAALVALVTLSIGSRQAVLWLIVPLLFVRHLARSPIKRTTLVIAGTIGVAALATLGLARYAQTGLGSSGLGSGIDHLMRYSVPGLDGVALASSTHPDPVPLGYGTDLVDAFLRFVPRALWPAKPDFDAEQLSNLFLGFQGGVSTILTAPGWLFANGLWAGVALGMAGLGALSRAVDTCFAGRRLSGLEALAFAAVVVTMASFLWAADGSIVFGFVRWIAPGVAFVWLATRSVSTRQAAARNSS